MSEGRKSQVVLFDERRLDINIQPKLYSKELLDLVASHFSLKEKEYFGLSFIDETGHQNFLCLDRKVLEHDFPRKSSGSYLVLYFNVRYYIESIRYLRDGITIELFYSQARQAISKGYLDIDSETAFELAAHVLQAVHGDFVEELTTRNQLKKLPVLPTSCLKEHPYIQYCEDKVIEYYQKLEGQTRGEAIVNYMSIIENLPTYGIHYYEVKDKNSLPWWLGLSYKGISQYDYSDKTTPRKVFPWRHLENLYYRDKKFSIEVHDAKRIVHTLSSFNLYEDAIHEPASQFDELSDAISDPTTQVSVSRRTFGPGNVNVYAWFGATPQLTKCIWNMAVAQHQFYVDRKTSKISLLSERSMTEIAHDITKSQSSLPGSEDKRSLSYSGSTTSLSRLSMNSKSDLSEEQLEANRAAQKDMYAALKSRKEAFEEILRKKTEELKLLCINEAELTGELPPEIPLNPGEPLPQFKKRMGTSFALSSKLFDRESNDEGDEILAKLELDYEIQSKITSAALKLAHNSAGAKTIRKSRKAAYQRALQKLKDIEKKLNEMRTMRGHAKLIHDKALDKSDLQSPAPSPLIQRTQQTSDGKVEIVEVENSKSVVISPPHTRPSMVSQSPQVTRHYSRGDTRGYTSPSHGYSSREQYRTQMYSGYRSPSVSSDKSQNEQSQDTLMKNTKYETSMGAKSEQRIHQSGYPPVRHGSLDNLHKVGKTQEQRRSRESLYSRGSSQPDDDRYRGYREYQQKVNNIESGAYGRSSPRAGNQQYGSLERRKKYYESDLPLQHLIPSKFGSKRDSHSEFGGHFNEPPDNIKHKAYDLYMDTDSRVYNNRQYPSSYGDRGYNIGEARRTQVTPSGQPPPYAQNYRNNREFRDYSNSTSSSGHSDYRDPHGLRSRHKSADILDEKPKYFPQTDRSQQQIIVQSPERPRVKINKSNSGSRLDQQGTYDSTGYAQRYRPREQLSSLSSNYSSSGDLQRTQYSADTSNTIPYIDQPATNVSSKWYEENSPASNSQNTDSSFDTSTSTDPRSPQYESPLNPKLKQDILNVSRDINNLSIESDNSSTTISPGVDPTSPQMFGPRSPGTRFQPFREVSKPFEMADFYKYSERLRRQRSVEHQDDSSSDHGSHHSSQSHGSQHSSQNNNQSRGLTKQTGNSSIHPLSQDQTKEDRGPYQRQSSSGPYVPHSKRAIQEQTTEPYVPGKLRHETPVIEQYESSPYKPNYGQYRNNNVASYQPVHDKVPYATHAQGSNYTRAMPHQSMSHQTSGSTPGPYTTQAPYDPSTEVQRSAHNQTSNISASNSFQFGPNGESVADAFSEEMIA